MKREDFLRHKYQQNIGNIELLIAYCHDTLGNESEAQPHYEKAMHLGFEDSELETWYVSYGSTLRWNGKLQLSLKILNKGLSLFPKSTDLPVMQAMTKYNLKLISATEVIDTVKKHNIKRLAWAKDSLNI